MLQEWRLEIVGVGQVSVVDDGVPPVPIVRHRFMAVNEGVAVDLATVGGECPSRRED